MSAPDTNIEKQKQRHKPALFGITAAVIWGGAMIVLLVGYVVWNGPDPTADAVTAAEQERGETTSTVETDPYAPGENNSASGN